LHALGAAIPHLTLLATSLPLVLPFPREEVKIDVQTETVDCTDEVIPEDEDEDIQYRVKGRSGLSILIRIGDVGVPPIWENGRVSAMGKKKGKERKRDRKGKKKAETGGGEKGERGEGEEDSATEYGDEDDLGMILDQENDEEGEDTGTFVYREGSQEDD
jgi:ribonuclease P/MRP protein subunit RPP20